MDSLTPYTGVLGARLAKHLLRRATFNITKKRIEEFSKCTPAQAIEKLAHIPDKKLTQPIHSPKADSDNLAPWIDKDDLYGDVKTHNTRNVTLRSYVIGWWMDEARQDTSYRSKLTYFLHTNFTATSKTLQQIHGAYYDYLRLLEFFSLGSWKELVYQITINPIMLNYLNNDVNSAVKPNENYARELLELFTIGKGPLTGEGDYTNYTELDVVQAARVLTGWRFHRYNKDPDSNRHKYTNGVKNGEIPCGYGEPSSHDFKEKKFSHRFDNYVIKAWDTSGKSDAEKKAMIEEELREFIDMILIKEETAKFICRKLYRYYVSAKITTEIETDIIVPLANKFRENYNLQETINLLFTSKHFYDLDDANSEDEIVGGLVKSPLELILQTFSFTNYPVPHPTESSRENYPNFIEKLLGDILPNCGQNPFDPPSVAGFPPYYQAPDFDKFWFNSATIIPRYTFTDFLLNPKKVKVDNYVATFIKNNVSEPDNPSKVVSELVDIMFPEEIDTDRLNYFLNYFLEDGEITSNMWSVEWSNYMKRGGDGVESVLKPLFRALIWSQEFQTN